MRNIIILSLALLFFGASGVCIAQTEEFIFYPCADVNIKTFGGGEGNTTFLKFDISALAPGQTINNVELGIYVFDVGEWDGDMLFWNADNQTWDESDTVGAIWNCPFSDTVTQLLGFGDTIGPASSVNLADIFDRDYEAGHTYCTIVMKDPDDETSVPLDGDDPYDLDDTLKVGNWLFGEGIMFRPREYSDTLYIPKLVVTYVPLGINEEKMLPSILKITAYPNPFNSSCAIAAPAGADVEIYDLRGNVVYKTPSIPRSLSPQGERDVLAAEDGSESPFPSGEGGSTKSRQMRGQFFIWQPDKSISSGIYLVRATTNDGRTTTKRIVYVK